MMNPRELVLNTLEFNRPARFPRHLWSLPWAQSHYPEQLANIQTDFPNDIDMPVNVLKAPLKTVGDAYNVGHYIDEWGCRFESRQAGIIGEVKHPLVTDISDLSKVNPPQESFTVDIDAVNAFCKNTDKFILAGCLPRPFERLQFLRGTENVMMDFALNLPQLKELLNIIHQFFIKELELWCKTDVDGMWFMDDWGAQQSLLISPAMWRELFKPLYADYIRIAHDHGKKAFMHSDGYIIDIIGDLVEVGLDALNSQIFCMDIETLGQRFKGKLTFWGEIDRQHLLPHGTPDDIAAAVRRVHRNLCDNGGVIAQLEFGPGAKPENVYAAFETWNRLRP